LTPRHCEREIFLTVRARETFITGAVDYHSDIQAIVWGPGRFVVFLRGEDARRSGTLLPYTISEGVSRLVFLSLTPYSHAWGYPTNFPLGHYVASYAADPSA
jgi:hypothetical protein